MGKLRENRCADLAKSIAAFLRKKEAQDIAFIYGKTMIMRTSWGKLADALAAAKPAVSVAVDRRALRKNDAAGMYSAGGDRITLKTFHPFRTANYTGTVVHECVHALQDRQASTMNLYEMEAAATLGKFWYHVNAGTPTLSDSTRKMLDLTAAIKARKEAMSLDMPVAVKEEERQAFKAYVATRWHYDGDEGRNDGWAD